MKKAIVFFFCCYLNLVSGQNLKISLEEIQTEDKLFTGSIDEKYEITAYIKFHNLSMDNLGIYSVKGWYYYDNVKKKIPLVGVYDGNDGGNLTLFSFKSKEKQDRILAFDNAGSTWQELDSIKGITDFDEKFDTYDNQWTDGKKKFKFKFYDNDYSVLKNYQLLTILDKTPTSDGESNKNINLNDIIEYHHDFELIGHLKTQSELKILLKYEHLSRANIQGMCGAGYEIGYIVLTFDNQFNLLNNETVEIESCLDNISNEELKGSAKNILKLKVTDNEDKSKIVTIDKKLIEIKIE